MAAERVGASSERAAPDDGREPAVGSACAVCQEPLIKVILL